MKCTTCEGRFEIHEGRFSPVSSPPGIAIVSHRFECADCIRKVTIDGKERTRWKELPSKAKVAKKSRAKPRRSRTSPPKPIRETNGITWYEMPTLYLTGRATKNQPDGIYLDMIGGK